MIPAGAYSAIDPCAGDGTALTEITRDTGAHVRAIELDADRAAACAQNGIETVHGSAFECRVLATINYTGLPLDVLEDALQRSTAMQNARGVLVREQQKLTGRPVLPLHKGGVGLLACSGMLNGVFGEGEMRHIAHWRSVKYVDEFTEAGEQEGDTIIHKRERFSHELTLAYANGNIVELSETKEGDANKFNEGQNSSIGPGQEGNRSQPQLPRA